MALDKLEKQFGNLELAALRRQAVAGDSWEKRINQFQHIICRNECRAKEEKE
jgi:hypothetical protein